MGETDKPLQGEGTNSRGAARNARAKVARKEKVDEEQLAIAYDRARQLLLEKVTAIRALEKEVAGLRGAMLGIIESYDLTAEQANTMIGFTYFAEQPDMDFEKKVENVIEKTAEAGAESTPEPEPVEGDEIITG